MRVVIYSFDFILCTGKQVDATHMVRNAFVFVDVCGCLSHFNEFQSISFFAQDGNHPRLQDQLVSLANSCIVLTYTSALILWILWVSTALSHQQARLSLIREQDGLTCLMPTFLVLRPALHSSHPQILWLQSNKILVCCLGAVLDTFVDQTVTSQQRKGKNKKGKWRSDFSWQVQG